MKIFKNWKFPSWINVNHVDSVCDDCGYAEKLQNVKNMTESEINGLLNKKCPVCGHIMLDSNDIKKLKTIIKRFHIEPEVNGIKANISYRTKKH